MASKRKIKKLEDLSPQLLRSATIVLCSEESVRCRYLPLFRKIAKKSSRLLIAMLAEELKKGSRGWAKTQILASLPGVNGVITCSRDDFKRLLKGEFGKVKQIGKIPVKKIRVGQTINSVDRKFMKRAFELVPKSSCWWRPTACLFVRDKEILIESACHNPYQTNCQALSIHPKDIKLTSGERISFCNAIHAEPMVIGRAARKGIPLDGSTLYITICPCEECVKILIEAGVKRVVFGGEYYDRSGLSLLKKYKIKVAKIKNVGN